MPVNILGFMGMPSGGEIILVLLVVLLLFGSKNLPKMARTLGKTLEEFRRASREVTDEIMHAEDELSRPTPDQRSPQAGNRASPPAKASLNGEEKRDGEKEQASADSSTASSDRKDPPGNDPLRDSGKHKDESPE